MKRLPIRIAGAAIASCWAQLAAAQGDLHVLYPAPGLEKGFGWSVSGAGDVDGDGFPDVVVGAPGAYTPAHLAGVVTVFSGRDAGALYSFPGKTGLDNLGWSVSDAGDVNGDGFGDIIAGAPCDYPDTTKGYARLYSGKNGATLHTWHANSLHDAFGVSVSGAGDINNDGFPDVLVGASMDDYKGQVDAGRARVYSLKEGLLYAFHGNSAGDQFGASVSDAGDVNNDGFPDFVVGAPKDEDTPFGGSGSVEILSGMNGTSLYHLLQLGPGIPLDLGGWVSDAGDVDADGYADVIVSGYVYYMMAAGFSLSAEAFVVSGKTGSSIRWFGDSYVAGETSRTVSGAGDIDGDGYSDVLLQVRAPDGIEAHSGKNGSSLFWMPGHLDDLFGRGLSDAGDINGDGIPEIVAGAPGDAMLPYVRIISTACGPISSIGQGCPGTALEAPGLDVTGCPVPGGSVSIVLDDASISPVPVLLVASSSTTSLPMGGGCSLLVAPPLTPFWTVTGSSGTLILETTIPMDAPLATLAVQGFIPDPAAPAGFRNTNAVLIAVE